MKSTIVFCTFLSLIFVFTQAEYVNSNKSIISSKVNTKSNTLKQTMAALTSEITSTRNFITDVKDVLKAVNPEVIDFTKIVLKNCDYERIEGNISYLTNVTVDLVFNVSDAIQSILDKGNECASEGFPKSLSCFLQLVNTCQVDIEEMKTALRVYIPLARGLLLNIFSDVVSCYTS